MYTLTFVNVNDHTDWFVVTDVLEKNIAATIVKYSKYPYVFDTMDKVD